MNHPVMVLPKAMNNLVSLNQISKQSGLPVGIIHMVHLRASQINGCSYCVELHSREMKETGESDERLFTVAAWREAPYFTDAERAALAMTEALCRINDNPDPVSDELWDEAARHYNETELAGLILAIASINVWNRLNVAVRQPAGPFAA
jgi:AhpD family alkylhydroperoxidase